MSGRTGQERHITPPAGRTELEAALAAIPDAVFLCDRTARIVNFNDAWVKFLRFGSRSECLESLSEYPDRFEVFWPGGEPAPVEQWAVPRALRGETAQDQEYLIRRIDTGETWTGSYSFAPTMEDGAITGAVIIARDITEQRRLQRELTDNESRLQAIADHTPDHILVQDAQLRYELVINPQLGLTVEGMLGKTDAEVLGAADAAAFTAIKRKVLDSGTPGKMARMVRNLQGEEEDIEGTFVPRLNAQGIADGIIGYCRNVTEQKRTQEALRASEENYRRLFENMTQGAFFQRADGVLTDCNPALLRIFGVTREEFLGRTSYAPEWRAVREDGTALPPEEHPSMLALRTGEAVRDRIAGLYNPQRDEYRWLSVSAIPLFRTGEERPWQAFVTVQDVTLLKRAESALRESERKYRVVADNTYDWEYWLSREGRFVYCSPSCQRITGYPPDGFLEGEGLLDRIVHADDRERLRAHGMAALDGTPCSSLEFRILHADGSTRWLAHVCEPVLDETGGFQGVRASNRDITERRAGEDALRQALLFRRQAERIARVGAWKVSPKSNYLYWTEGVYEILGAPLDYKPGLQEGLTFYDAESLPVLQSALTRALEDGTPFVIETGLTTWGGKQHLWTEVRGLGRIEEDGEAFVMGTFQDVTSRREAERVLRESEQKYRRLHESITDAVAAVDMTGRIVEVNPALQAMLGYTAEELTRLEYQDITPERWHQMEAAVVTGQVLVRGYSDVYEKEYRRKDGTTLPVELRTYLLRDEAGQATGMWAIVRDISAKKRAEEEGRKLQAQLVQAQKMESIGRLAGGVAHDFNNLLTVINGYSNLVLTKLSAADPLRAQVKLVHEAGERAAELTRQLLAFSRKQLLQPRVLDLNEVVAGMQTMLQRLLGEDVKLRLSLSPQDLAVAADLHQFEQVIMNLAVNARDAMPAGGQLLIETGVVETDNRDAESRSEMPAGRYVMLGVSDTGVGMDEATRQRIFEPFFTTKDLGKGTGLGLSMAQGIVAQSGGYIDVYSAPGHGTTFKVYLPLLTTSTAAVPLTEPAVVMTGTETILVVEDQEEVGRFAVAALKAFGYRAIAAADAEEGLRICARNEEPIHMLLTDVVMPNVSGPEFAERLRQIQPEMKVLFMSGYAEQTISRLGGLGAETRFLQKPFSPEALARKVREVLGPVRSQTP